MRSIDAEFKVDSTFVKAAPTVKTYRIIEYGPTCIRVHCVNRTRDIPYCDTFDVEDLLLIHGIKESSKNCVVQIGISFVWHKSSMVKRMIQSNAEKEARAMNADYTKLLQKYPFVEQKKPAPKVEPGAPLPVDDYTS